MIFKKSFIQNALFQVSQFTHYYICLKRNGFAKQAKLPKPTFLKRNKPLAKIDPNGCKKRKQKSQTRWACENYNSIKTCCRKPECWNAFHHIF